jgi:hypothetical protein
VADPRKGAGSNGYSQPDPSSKGSQDEQNADGYGKYPLASLKHRKAADKGE